MNMGTWGRRHWRRGDTVTWRQWGCSDMGTSWGWGGTGIVGMGGHGDGGMEGWRDGGMGGRRAGGPWRCVTSAEQPMGAHAVPTDGAAPRPLPERLLLESVGRRRGGLWGGRDGVGMRGHDGDVALRDVVLPPPPHTTVPVSLTHAPTPHCVPLQEAVRAQPRKWLWGGAGVGNRRWGGHCWGGHRGGGVGRSPRARYGAASQVGTQQ